MAVHARHSCWSRPEQAAAAVEQSACLFVVAASPSRRSSWRTRASTRTVVGMSIERWCPLNMVRLDRRSAHRVSTAACSEQSALPGAVSQLSPEHNRTATSCPTLAVSGTQHCRQTVVRPPRAGRDRWCRPAGCTASAERVERVASGVEPAACGSTEPRPRRALRRAARRRGGAPRGRPEDGRVVAGPRAHLRGRRGRATPRRASAEHGAAAKHGAAEQRSHR